MEENYNMMLPHVPWRDGSRRTSKAGLSKSTRRRTVRHRLSFLTMGDWDLETRVVPTTIPFGPASAMVAFDGDFNNNNTSYASNAGDTVTLGFNGASGYVPVITFQGGTVSFDTSSTGNYPFDVSSTTMKSGGGMSPLPSNTLWSGSSTLNLSDLLGTGLALTNPSAFSVYGASFTLTTLKMSGGAAAPQLAMPGNLEFTTTSGSTTVIADLDVPVNNSNSVILSAAGTTFASNNFTLSTTETYQVLNQPFSATSMALTFDPGGLIYNFSGGASFDSDIVGSSFVGLKGQGTYGSAASPSLKLMYDAVNNDLDTQQNQLTMSGLASLAGIPLEIDDSQGGVTLVQGSDPTNAANPALLATGTFKVPLLFDTTVQIGTNDNSAIVITTNGAELDGFTIKFNPIKLPGFALEEMFLTVDAIPNQAPTVTGGGQLNLPGDWSVEAELQLLLDKNDEWLLDGIGLGIGGDVPIPGTGLRVTALAGEVLNVLTPSQWLIGATITVDFGDSIKIPDTNISINLVEVVASGTLSTSEFVFSGSISVLTVYDNNLDPSFDLAKGEATVTLDWNKGQYGVETDLNVLDGTFLASLSFSIDDSLAINAQGTATINVPDIIPVIGGDTLLSGGFAFEMNPTASGVSGFVAGWIGLGSQDIGLDVNFASDASGISTNSSLIGTQQVQAIESGSTSPSAPYLYTRQFTVPAGATGALFAAEWPASNGGTQTYTVTFPLAGGGTSQVSSSGFNPSVNGFALHDDFNSTTERVMAITARDPNPNDDSNQITAGTYTVQISSSSILTIASDGWYGGYAFQRPTVKIDQVLPVVAGSSFDIQMSGSFDSSFAEGAQVKVLIGEKRLNQPGFQVQSFSFTPSNAPAGKFTSQFNADLSGYGPNEYFVFASINDGVNPPRRSLYSTMAAATAAVSGTVIDVGPVTNGVGSRNDAVPNATVYLDANGNGMLDGNEISQQTGADGTYQFTDSQVGTTTKVGLVVPDGYDYAPTPPGGPNPITILYNNQGLSPNNNFSLQEKTSIAGTVFTDINGNGIFDPSPMNPEQYQSNVTVTLVGPNNLMVTAVTNQQGGYNFINLQPSTQYTVSIAADTDVYYLSANRATTTVTTGSGMYDKIESPPGVSATTNFPIILYGTISGNVSQAASANTQEVPLNAWQINLYNGAALVQQVSTNSNGDYTFKRVKPSSQIGANYSITQTVKPGYRQIAPFSSQVGFQTSTYTTTGGNSLVATGDFNKDGNQDFLLHTNDSGIDYANVYTGNGRGGFNRWAWKALNEPPLSLVAADFDGDSYLDFASLGMAEGKYPYIDVYLNGGIGSFDLKTLVSSSGSKDDKSHTFDVTSATGGDVVDSISNIAAVKFGQDGNASAIVAAHYKTDLGTNQYKLFQFQLSVANPIHSTSSLQGQTGFVGNVVAVDFSGDGNPDVVGNLGNNPSDTSQLTFVQFTTGNNSDNALPGTPTYVTVPGNNYTVSAAPINGDSKADLVIVAQASNNGGTTAVYPLLNNGSSGWLDANGGDASSAAALVTFSAGQYYFNSPIQVDVDGDLALDLVAAMRPYLAPSSTYPGSMAVYLNSKSAPYFSTAQTFSPHPTTAVPNSLAAADFNNDGLIDFVVADQGTQGGYWIMLNTSKINDAIPVTVGFGQSLSNQNFINGQTSQVYGVVTNDVNANGQRDAADAGVAGVPVFLDLNRNGSLDPSEPYTVTGAYGQYAFKGLAPGSYSVQVAHGPGRKLSNRNLFPGEIQIVSGANSIARDFHLATRFDLSVPGGDWSIALNGDSLEVQNVATGVVAQRQKVDEIDSITFTSAAGRPDRYTIDFSRGTFTLRDGIQWNSRDGALDSLVFVSGGYSSSATLNDSGLSFETKLAVTWGSSTIPTVNLLLGDGDDSVIFEGNRFKGRSLFIDGGAGNDHFTLAAPGARTTIRDESGHDLLDFSRSTAGVTVDLAKPGLQRLNHLRTDLILEGAIEDLYGSFRADRLRGNHLDNLMHGLGGDDLIEGRDGSDMLIGNAGRDLLRGGPGRNVIIGGDGLDTLIGSLEDDLLIGGRTTHDDNDEALQAILAEWDSNTSFATRVGNLGNSSPSPDRLNGSYFLDASTVPVNRVKDRLQPGGGENWIPRPWIVAPMGQGLAANPRRKR